MSAQRFATATIDPFNPSARGAALPTGSCPASHRVSAVIRTDATLGSDGTLALMVNPSIASDCACVWVTSGGNGNYDLDNGFDMSGITAQNYFGGEQIIAPQFSNPNILAYAASSLPYDANAVIGTTDDTTKAPLIRGRVVSCGVKITFTGATLSDGGVFYSLVEPTHDSLRGVNVGTLSQYTATKVQRGAIRKEIELNLFPVRRSQMEFSSTYDDLTLNLGAGVVPINIVNSPKVGFAGGYASYTTNDLASTMSDWCVPTDGVTNMRNLMSLLYPLSRKNNAVTHFQTPASTASNTLTIGAGVLTWQGVPALPSPKWRGHVVSTAANHGYYLKTQTGAERLVNTSNAVDLVVTQTASTYKVSSILAAPAVYAGVLINAGAAMAGQTVHVEYIVHVEYAGLGVQGRTNPIVPDEHALSVTHAIVDHAREICGQNEMAEIKDCAIHAFEKFAPAIAPTAAATIADALVPGSGGEVAKGVSALIGAIKGMHKKRKL